jgi:hypothetical protein
MYREALIDIEDICLDIGGVDLSMFNMQRPYRAERQRLGPMMLREQRYNHAQLATDAENVETELTDEQRIVYDSILQRVNAENQLRPSFHFLDAPGGTGKTFLLNAILDKVRSQHHVALAVASSGIAATLLHGGRTAHSTLQIPLDLVRAGRNVLNTEKGSDAANVIQAARLLVWDEATMIHKAIYEATERTFKTMSCLVV